MNNHSKCNYVPLLLKHYMGGFHAQRDLEGSQGQAGGVLDL